jgi:hypothetical protein
MERVLIIKWSRNQDTRLSSLLCNNQCLHSLGFTNYCTCRLNIVILKWKLFRAISHVRHRSRNSLPFEFGRRGLKLGAGGASATAAGRAMQRGGGGSAVSSVGGSASSGNRCRYPADRVLLHTSFKLRQGTERAPMRRHPTVLDPAF